MLVHTTSDVKLQWYKNTVDMKWDRELLEEECVRELMGAGEGV